MQLPLFCAYNRRYVLISWWRHQMETFSALLAICGGNSPIPGELPAQRPVTWSFDVFFDLRLNKRLSKQPRGWWFETPSWSLWRHGNVDFLKAAWLGPGDTKWYHWCFLSPLIQVMGWLLNSWGRDTYISHDGFVPDRRQAIIWTNAGLLSVAPLGTNVIETWIKNTTIFIKESAFKCLWNGCQCVLNIGKPTLESMLSPCEIFTERGEMQSGSSVAGFSSRNATENFKMTYFFYFFTQVLVSKDMVNQLHTRPSFFCEVLVGESLSKPY